MSFSPVGSAISFQPHSKSLSFDLDDMIKKAKTYAEDDEGLLGYISNVLNDSAFQANPKGYFAAWEKRTWQNRRTQNSRRSRNWIFSNTF